MPVFLAGAALAFWWLFKNGVGSPKPAVKKLPAPTPKANSVAAAPAAQEAGVGEDYIPEGQKIAPPPKKPAPAPAQKAVAPAEDKKNLSLPARKGGKGSFDDDLPDGEGADDVDLSGFGGDDDIDLDGEEEA